MKNYPIQTFLIYLHTKLFSYIQTIQYLDTQKPTLLHPSETPKSQVAQVVSETTTQRQLPNLQTVRPQSSELGMVRLSTTKHDDTSLSMSQSP